MTTLRLKKLYRGRRLNQDLVEVLVDVGDVTRTLTHLVRHSPTGMGWGYDGSRPADLARSILVDLFDEPDIHPAIYMAFKAQAVAHFDAAWEYTELEIRRDVEATLDAFHVPGGCIRCLGHGIGSAQSAIAYCSCPKGIALNAVHAASATRTGVEDHLLGEGRN